MTATALLTELETETYDYRVRRMVALGQQAAADAETAALLQALATSPDYYERLLALLACYGSRNDAAIAAALADPSRLLRQLALTLAAKVGTDAQALAALAGLPRRAQTKLLRTLRQRRRLAVIDAFLESLAATQAPEQLALLLFFGSAAVVQRHLPTVLPRWGTIDWARLARFHPDAAFAQLHSQLRAQTGPDARLLAHTNAALPALAEHRPAHALALVRELLRHESPARVALTAVAARRPNEVADLLLTHADGAAAHLDLSSQVPRLAEDRLLAVLRHRPALVPGRATWLPRVPPAVRRAAFALVGAGWRNPDGVVPAALVALLPGHVREAEGRRHLALPALATRPAARLPYATFLPWPAAHELLMPFVQNPDAELRAVALGALLGVARYHRRQLPQALALVLARANEQDPVRQVMLAALAALPPARWQAAQLESLSQLLRDALNAADLSPGTAREAEKLVVALVPFHPAWAAGWLGELARARGVIYFPALGDRLNDADVRRIAPALLPVLKAWATRERETWLVEAARRLGRRLRVFDELVELLEQLLASTRQGYVASEILQLLARHRPARLVALVPALLASDPSVVTLPVVYRYLHRRRQDLLTPFLGQQAYKGRFSTGKTRFVLPLLAGFYRWTARQQHLFADTLTQLTHDEKRDLPSLFRAVWQLAALPALVPPRLLALADARMERLALRDTALRALGQLDGGQGVPVLLAALDDVRARVAIYALRPALLDMPAPQALALLQAVPTNQVTVAKEVLRLLGELDLPGSYALLLSLAAQPLHRDVRVALLRALWGHLEQPQTWPILHRAATDPDPAVAAGVVWIPTDRLSALAQQQLRALLVALLHHADAALRVQVLTRYAALPLADPQQALLPALLAALHSPLPDESRAAARALFASYASENAAAVAGAIGQVRDNRRVLQTALAALQTALATNRSQLLAVVRATLAALRPDLLTVLQQVQLAVAALPWPELAAYLAELAAQHDLHAEACMAAVQAIEASGPRLEAAAEAAALPAFEQTMAAHADARLRRLGLAALLAQASQATGWTAALRTRLAQYRADPAPLVAAAAQFVFPPAADAAAGA